MADSFIITPSNSTRTAKETASAGANPLSPTSSSKPDGTVVEASPTPDGPKRSISTRAFLLMAVGSSIGAGLFFASGTAIEKGGPGAVVLAFSILGLAVWLTMCALGELAATVPVQGSFYDYSLRFISPSWGFAMGWNYVLNFVLIVAFEIAVIVMATQYFWPEGPTYLMVLSMLPLLALHLWLGGKGYSETEFGFSILKIGVLVLFTVLAIVIASGGTPDAGGRGFENYQNGNAFRNGFQGFLSVFVAAGMAYGGTEMLGLSVAECKHPRKVMPLASMIVAGRIVFCYVLPLFCVGLVVHPSLFSLPEFAGLHVISPFVVAARVAGLPGLATAINLALLLAVFSMANASVFASSRAMAAICRQRMGPAALGKYKDVSWKIGSFKVEVTVPTNALGAVAMISQLAWIVAYSRGALIFDWLLALASISNYYTWISICVCHIRFRSAMRLTGHHPKDLTWKSPFGIYGSYLAITIVSLCMISQVVSAALPPVTETEMSRAELVWMGTLGFVIVSLLFFGYHLYLVRRDGKTGKSFWIPLGDIALPELDSLTSTGTVAETLGKEEANLEEA